MEIRTLTIKEAGELLRKRHVSVPELVEHSLERIEEVDPKIHAFLLVGAEHARQQAQVVQQRLDAGEELSPLAGIPMAHKDMFCTEGIETTAASTILKGYIPPYSATAVRRLEAAGAIMMGKLNCDAFAHGSSTENSDFGPTRNPYHIDYVPGGSSGGSAAAAAAGEVLFATGTDTGGSIRHPASFTNTVGLKPTYGRVSRFGVIAMASSMDCPGPITRTVEDCAYVLGVMAGHDPYDATSSQYPVPAYEEFLGRDIKGLRVGVPKEFFTHGLDARVEQLVRAALKQYEELGCSVEAVSLPHVEYALAAYYISMFSEVSSNLARYDGIKYGFSVESDPDIHPRTLQEVYEQSRGRGFGSEAKRRIMLGTFALSRGYYDAYYKKAMQVRELIRQDFLQAFETHDLLVGPVSPTPPFRLGEKTADPLAMYLSDIYTTSINLSGNPGMSVPCGFVEGLPVGLHIIAPHFAEARLLQAAYAYEQATKWYERFPQL